MKKKKSPENLGEQVEIKQSSYGNFINDIYGEIQSADNSRTSWKEKLTRWYKKRYGVRPAKNFPWPGCSNLHIPLVDKTIRKIKPSYAQLVDSPDPICYFDPVGPEDVPAAGIVGQFFNWLVRVRMKVFFPIVLLIDKMLEKGFGILKIIYEYRTKTVTEILDIAGIPQEVVFEEITLTHWLTEAYGFGENDFKQVNNIVQKMIAGEKKIEISREVEEYNAPKWIVKDPLDIIVPPDTTDLQSARWICDRSYCSPNDLLSDAKAGKYDLAVVREIIELKAGKKKETAETIDTEKESREGVYDFVFKDSDLIEIWETCCYYDLNNDEIKEKCILTFCPEYLTDPLRFIEYPYRHGRWPYVKFLFEHNDEDYYSPRGIPEILDHLQTEMTIQHNAKIDRQTLTNSLTFKFIPGVINPANVRFIPGQAIPVNRMDALEVITVPNVETSYEREEQILKAWAEEYIGVTDFGVSSPLQPMTEARTKYEIQTINQLKQQVFTLDGRVFQESLKDAFEQTWALWLQYGPEEVFIRVMNNPMPIKTTKKEIWGNFDIVPAGRVGNTNPVLETQKALANLQMFNGDPYINQKELRTDYLRKMDPRLAERLLLSDEMVNMGLQARQQAAQQEGQKGKQSVQVNKTVSQPDQAIQGAGI